MEVLGNHDEGLDGSWFAGLGTPKRLVTNEIASGVGSI